MTEPYERHNPEPATTTEKLIVLVTCTIAAAILWLAWARGFDEKQSAPLHSRKHGNESASIQGIKAPSNQDCHKGD